jgi:hypothetical protein
MWRREFFENIKWNPGQPNQKWRSNTVSAGHVRSKTELLQADKWFVFISIRLRANLRSAEGAESLVAWGNAPGQWLGRAVHRTARAIEVNRPYLFLTALKSRFAGSRLSQVKSVEARFQRCCVLIGIPGAPP